MGTVVLGWFRWLGLVVLFAVVSSISLVGCGGGRTCNDVGDCLSGEQCIATNCVITQPQSCQVDGDCLGQQRCQNQRCETPTVPSGCKQDSECPEEQTCQNGACKEKPASTGCDGDSDCTAPTPKCNSTTRTCHACLAQDDCSTNQECKDNNCVEKVDPNKCTTDQDCEGKALPKCSEQGQCEWECKTDGDCSSKGSNFACESHLCKEKKATNTCDPNGAGCPNGEVCLDIFPTSSRKEYRCFQTCKPSAGGVNNPSCSSGEGCAGTRGSPTGGACIPLPSRKEGELCPTILATCMSGLRCDYFTGRCVKSCRDASTCGGNQQCVVSGSVFCANTCDPAKGEFLNPDCNGMQRCRKHNIHKPGYCQYLAKPNYGSLPLGATCTTTAATHLMHMQCNGFKKQTCHPTNKICVRGCDPSKGLTSNPDCNGGSCQTSLKSSFGGYCN